MESYIKKKVSVSGSKKEGSFTTSDETANKTSKVGRSSISDIETGDALFDSLKLDHNSSAVKIKDEQVYTGQTLYGKKNGKGVIKNSKGVTIYDGYFKNDLYEGEGTLINENGFVYNGQFEKGVRSGKGLFFSNDDKYKYEGEWLSDMKSGKGTETYPDGSSFTGEFTNNQKNGTGVYYMNDGSIYEGEFLDDKIHGTGKFTWVDNKFYQGEWKNNSIDGFGIFIRNEKVYIGRILKIIN
jgi:hypothetical protein